MKALKWLVILLVIVAVVAAAYLFLPRKPKTPSGASLLPADTFLFLQIPDVPKAREDFKTTSLYKIWSEPEVKEFFRKSTDFAKWVLDEKAAGTPAMSLSRRVLDLPQGELFLAVSELGNIQRHVPPMVLGMDVKEKRADADKWLADLKEELKKHFSSFKESSENYNGVGYTRWSITGADVCYAYFVSMLVVTSNEEAMKGAIDHYKDRKSPSLATDERYLNAMKKMPTAHAALAYCNPKPLTALLKGFAVFMPQLQSTMRNMDATRSVSYSTTFENGSFKDVFFVDAPADKRGDLGSESKVTERKTLPLTSTSTVLYVVQSLDLGKTWDLLYQQFTQSPVPKLQEALFALDQFNREHGWNMPKEFLDAVGPEYALSLNWEEGAKVPEFFFALEVKDKAKAGATLDKLWQLGKSASDKTGVDLFVDTPHEGQTIHSVNVPMTSMSPSYTLTDRFFLLTLQADTAKGLITKLKNGGKSLADNATYQNTMREMPSGASSYSFLDTRNLFERTYGLLQPFVQRGAAYAPGLKGYVDIDKMPQAKTIGQYLKPTASAQVVDKDGFTTVIISPIGTPSIAVAAVVASGVAVAQKFPNFPMK